MSSLTVGNIAPVVKLPADDGSQVDTNALKGKNIVVYFYPKDDTPGCTTEAQGFRDFLNEFEKANTIILGISKDSLNSHCKFKEKYSLNFQLLSDEDGKVCDAYGVWQEKSMMGKKYMGIVRSTFLIDSTGKLAKIWRNVSVTGHVEEVLKSAAAL